MPKLMFLAHFFFESKLKIVANIKEEKEWILSRELGLRSKGKIFHRFTVEMKTKLKIQKCCEIKARWRAVMCLSLDIPVFGFKINEVLVTALRACTADFRKFLCR